MRSSGIAVRVFAGLSCAMLGGVLAPGVRASSAFAPPPSGAQSNPPPRFQIDTGYFYLMADTRLRFEAPLGPAGDVDFERDLGQDEKVNTFWVDGTWHLGRRHQLKLGYTRLSRDRGDQTLQRDFVWGGETFNAGLNATSSITSDVLGGYYRFAIVRKDRFEIGPSIGIGYLWVSARVQATGTVGGPGGSRSRDLDRSGSTGSITGALGAYTSAWLTRKLVAQGDFLYIKVTPENAEASVVDWRLAADYYFFSKAGLGVQYKYNRYRQDRSILAAKLGGDITFKGLQVFASFRF